MVRLYSHLSTLGLPSWTRHSYGHQLQHLAWFSWCSIGIRTFKYRKRQQYLHSYSVYSVWFYGKFNRFFLQFLDAIMDINQFQLLFQCLDAVMGIEYFTSINLLIFILLQTETTYYFSCLQHNIFSAWFVPRMCLSNPTEWPAFANLVHPSQITKAHPEVGWPTNLFNLGNSVALYESPAASSALASLNFS